MPCGVGGSGSYAWNIQGTGRSVWLWGMGTIGGEVKWLDALWTISLLPGMIWKSIERFWTNCVYAFLTCSCIWNSSMFICVAIHFHWFIFISSFISFHIGYSLPFYHWKTAFSLSLFFCLVNMFLSVLTGSWGLGISYSPQCCIEMIWEWVKR